ncbi:sodium/potassium-transporting ATPase subunit alpha-2-like [Orussus abietinus]|uniref:sodium/potassium-transporting ATPase subunit alpha-2-like n=1 Tax=Orussus abietinus TaxID=222816 RepID=UPI0006253FE8|nr:sodium/potassium-transporting ATPase subunit alpha-2-like [Orussus abietinus]
MQPTVSKVSQLKRASSMHVHKKKLNEEELDALHAEFETKDHTIPIRVLCQKLKTNLTRGLSEETAAEILLQDGPNSLTPPKVTPEWIKFLSCTFKGFAGLLWGCGGLCFILYAVGELMHHEEEAGIEWLGVIICTICIISGLFSYTQQTKNAKIMESFTQMVPSFAVVIRDGKRMQIPTEEVVIGDLIEIGIGDKIPADIRIIASTGLRVENSSLTGESEPLSRTEYPTDNNPLESKNIAFFSSFAVAGEGKGIAIATGDKTMIGRLAVLTAQLKKTDTPIAKEIAHFVNIIVSMAILCGCFFFILSLAMESSIIKAFTYLVGILIANVPEVLLVTVTTSLTLTAKKMAKKNCLVKNLEAVETLGSTSIICSDKTGTLTQNKMTVSHLNVGGVRYKVPSDQQLGAERDLLLEKPAFNVLIKDATLCLRAEFKADSSIFLRVEEREVLGDASETGILKFCEHIHETRKFRSQHAKVAEIPFNSTAKYQLSIHLDVDGYVLVMKGAPEVVLDFCNSVLQLNGQTASMTPMDLSEIRKTCMELGYLGERVLAYCDLALSNSSYGAKYEFNTERPEEYNFPVKGYRFVGLISLIDPPRATVPDAVHKCRTAGIKVIMVTGDHPVTAMAIAKKVGIIGEGHETRYEKALLLNKSYSQITEDEQQLAIVVTGGELRNMGSEDLDRILRNYGEIVFARTSPQQKLLIVESCQRLGEVVAVTGDGVNDSPALRKADIGIAMGITGSDVAKNAADMILMDDNFASIVIGIEEGRLIFDNLKKSIAYTLTSSVPEMLPILVSIIMSIPLPFVIEMVLCVDVGTDLIPAIALAYEKPESDIMKRAPRNPQYDKLVNKRLISMTYGQIGMTQAVAGFYSYFVILAFNGFLPKDLFGLRKAWDSKSINDLVDSYGQTWNYKNRMDLLNEARTGYFISIVILQMVDLIICKTRRNSIFQQGMNNWFLNFSIVFEVVLTGILLYVPGMNKVIKTMPLDAFWYWPCLPYAIFLWVYDEIRRLIIRIYPNGCVEKETYY